MDLTVEKVEKIMYHTLKYLYARMVLDFLPDVVTENCFGCEVSHPSQTHHTCLMWINMEHLDIYFDMTYKKIDEKDVVSRMKDQVDLMDISNDYKHEFISDLEDWCSQHKPSTENVFHWCKQLALLEERLTEN